MEDATDRAKELARARAARKRYRETPEEKEERLAKGRLRMAKLRRSEGADEAARRREKNRARVAARRQLASDDEKEKWKQQARERARLRRESETLEARNLRREHDRLRMQQKRAQTDEFKVSFSMYMADARSATCIDPDNIVLDHDDVMGERPTDPTVADDDDVAHGLWPDKPFC
ncbi:hypothetical protein SDRG_09005 [Saprolegnia diclina VS20]|uniref:Uncharacterized protein n=1 Tax=Saprolegnia diclina (strain VS20) TaxID=1156394 RepID=T0QFM2_SAPDV|nr:hypothetical protein SDRG_09005 [Saprolegnia diclina VS20]EQC33496.1 hypothetical protein SDRG_09005 [Saprolegnia diclina VS20]|eukprot:XP_008613136.1 hypothetical protein SDRG_09005 [Saprolegnia diclina VS20]